MAWCFFWQVSRLSGVIREKDSALELMKAQDRETKRVERNTAALIAISTAPDQLSSLAARITSMVRLVKTILATFMWMHSLIHFVCLMCSGERRPGE